MNTIYFVPNAHNSAPETLDVTWVGSTHFMAGEYTFKYTKGRMSLGQHRAGTAYESRAMYEAACAARDAWERLRFAISEMKEPPEHLSALLILDAQQLLFHAK